MSLSVYGPCSDVSADAERILRGLPEWFGIESSLVSYVHDVTTMPTFAARTNGRVVGFLTIKRHFQPAAEIHVLAVDRACHRRGIGRALLDHVEAWLRDDGVAFLQVKTVGPSHSSTHYAATRQFYERMGFVSLEQMKTLWGERNPCLLMIKAISVQRPTSRCHTHNTS